MFLNDDSSLVDMTLVFNEFVVLDRERNLLQGSCGVWFRNTWVNNVRRNA